MTKTVGGGVMSTFQLCDVYFQLICIGHDRATFAVVDRV